LTRPDISSAIAEVRDAVEVTLSALDQAKAHALFRAALKAHPGGQVGWARDHGVSPQFVSDVLHHRREISETIAAALGLQRRTVFVRTDHPTT
jgi:hypothetical protein